MSSDSNIEREHELIAEVAGVVNMALGRFSDRMEASRSPFEG